MLVPITMAVGMDVRLPGMPETAIAGGTGGEDLGASDDECGWGG